MLLLAALPLLVLLLLDIVRFKKVFFDFSAVTFLPGEIYEDVYSELKVRCSWKEKKSSCPWLGKGSEIERIRKRAFKKLRASDKRLKWALTRRSKIFNICGLFWKELLNPMEELRPTLKIFLNNQKIHQKIHQNDHQPYIKHVRDKLFLSENEQIFRKK